MPDFKLKKTVCVVGLGYIGLPTAAVLASRGYKVLGVDINPKILECIESGTAHIAETDLDLLIESAVSSERLKVSLKPASADIFIIAVPTPLTLDKSPDLSAVEAAFDSIAPYIKSGDLVILESTCPVGTTSAMLKRIADLRPDLCYPSSQAVKADFNIAYCPERVLPGMILKELIENDRVVGGITPGCTQQAVLFYQSFVKGDCLATDSKTAEMCKLTENSYRDVNIAFANELSMICDEHDINIQVLIHLANHHPRVNILKPSPGVGGHCIAIDPWFLIHSSEKYSKLIKAARDVNNLKTSWVIEKILLANKEFFENNKSIPVISLLGVTYKENVDDVRESPALKVVNEIIKLLPNKIFVVDPNVKEHNSKFDNPKLNFCSLSHALDSSDMIIKLVCHDQFCVLDTRKNQKLLDFS